ncbi:hypothetical protein LEMA_P031920.1 [Plenodomus lingam JN3]|uniref:Uncharacterized protein n=1 Tax=Leptosphaeria maculans (strain JN3 / isolate v23.1.3 / race Av1-4-5-6-7-8) TaxID=985895 RepID=E4ZWR4_LEPMJ|nr:hypothetical protein LEMA_P031920.1 [Plenodomus lingam JN3]CBX96040.1 hypothetical protein LEMA_P031920.1 [Plenodomus lingam JN3]
MPQLPPKPLPFTVKDKVAIITGAGSGINLSFATLLLSHGCNVLLADLHLRPEAQTLVSQYRNPHARPRALFQHTDVTHWPDLTALFTTAAAEFGRLDIVCPGAGIYDPESSNFWHPPGVEGGRSRDDVAGGSWRFGRFWGR